MQICKIIFCLSLCACTYSRTTGIVSKPFHVHQNHLGEQEYELQDGECKVSIRGQSTSSWSGSYNLRMQIFNCRDPRVRDSLVSDLLEHISKLGLDIKHLQTIYLGQVSDYPDIALCLATNSLNADFWDKDRGRPVRSLNINQAVETLLRDNCLKREFFSIVRGYFHNLSYLRVEKVSIGKVTELDMAQELLNAGGHSVERVPFDAVIYLMVDDKTHPI